MGKARLPTPGPRERHGGARIVPGRVGTGLGAGCTLIGLQSPLTAGLAGGWAALLRKQKARGGTRMGNHPHDCPPTRHPLGGELLPFLPSQSHSSQGPGAETAQTQVAKHGSHVPFFSVRYNGPWSTHQGCTLCFSIPFLLRLRPGPGGSPGPGPLPPLCSWTLGSPSSSGGRGQAEQDPPQGCRAEYLPRRPRSSRVGPQGWTLKVAGPQPDLYELHQGTSG